MALLPANSTVPREEPIELTGSVAQVLPGAMFRVALPNGLEVLAHISGKIRKNFSRISVGDKVNVEMSPPYEQGAHHLPARLIKLTHLYSRYRRQEVIQTIVRPKPHWAVRKSESIAKICGEPTGGCAKLDCLSEIYFFISPERLIQNDQLKIYG